MRVERIALFGKGLAGWGGGNDFLRILASGLSAQSHRFVLCLPRESLASQVKSLARPYKRMLDDIVHLKYPTFYKSKFIDLKSVANAVGSFGADIDTTFYKDSGNGLVRLLGDLKIDVVAPCVSSLGKSFPVPWVGYIPDLQHKYFPQFFTSVECRNRDTEFLQVLSDSKAVIVNSVAVKNSIEHFYPGYRSKVFDLPFAPVPVLDWLEAPEKDVQAAYKLPKRYFLISNQFWIHKSHITAFEALSLINKRTGLSDVEIVCTGSTQDYRFPNYFRELDQKINSLGIRDKVQILGHIPKVDQIQIMRGSIAVLQPSLFEGGPGGGAVYDAVALGVPAIVSDIPINREITEKDIDYFQPQCAEELAEKMMARLRFPREVSTNEDLLQIARERTSNLGARLFHILEHACDLHAQ